MNCDKCKIEIENEKLIIRNQNFQRLIKELEINWSKDPKLVTYNGLFDLVRLSKIQMVSVIKVPKGQEDNY